MRTSIKYCNTLIEYEVTYSRRKTMAITIDPSGEVRVAVPKGTATKIIQDWVGSKAPWITGKLNQIELAKASRINREFAAGEIFWYLGREYPLYIEINPKRVRPTVDLYGDRLNIEIPDAVPSVVKKALQSWYRSMAEWYFGQRVEQFGERIRVSPNRITIREQKTRWGSCSSKGNLNFNWRAMMAPAVIVDYLVVHELCHLIHPNHSRHFWDTVGAVMPDYQAHRSWLRENGYRLTL